MAKPLVFEFDGQNIAFQMSKVDRAQLYGYKDVEVLDDKNGKCELATLAGDGRTVVGRGGVALGYLSQDGLWCDRGELKPVNLEGNTIQPVASSFSAPVPLVERVSIDEYLEHNIRSVYIMQADGDADISAIESELEGGTIFKFPYSFRGGLEADAGFLLRGGGGETFFAVGNPTSIEMVGLQQAVGTFAEEGDEEEPEGDMMDFGMI